MRVRGESGCGHLEDFDGTTKRLGRDASEKDGGRGVNEGRRLAAVAMGPRGPLKHRERGSVEGKKVGYSTREAEGGTGPGEKRVAPACK